MLGDLEETAFGDLHTDRIPDAWQRIKERIGDLLYEATSRELERLGNPPWGDVVKKARAKVNSDGQLENEEANKVYLYLSKLPGG